MEMLVGPDGRTWNPYGSEFVRHLGYFGGDTKLAYYATRNLGFAHLIFFPRYTRVRIQPSLFPQACLERVIEMLLYYEPPRIVIERVGVLIAPLEVMMNLDDAFARLRVLQAATPEENPPPNIIGLSMPRLSSAKRSGMRAALKAWKAAHGYASTRDIQAIANDPLFGGGAVAWLPSRDRCLIEAWPSTYQKYNDPAAEKYLGWDIRDLPDSKYLMPTTRAYFTVAQEAAPRLELIEALVTHHDGSKYWSRYERLILPWRTRSSDSFVSSVPLVRLIRRC